MITVNTREKDSVIIVDVTGEVEMHSSPELRKVLVDLAGKETSRIAVNLSDVTYMDSSGIATLVECMQRTNRYQGMLSLFGMSPEIRNVFELARLDSIFDIRTGEEDVLA